MPLSASIRSDALGPTAEMTRELARRRADLVEHGRGSLREHLVGVHDVLSCWGQPERVRLAGLAHSVYSTEAFRVALFPREERWRLRELIGPDAERLAFAFCACRREALITAAEHDGGAVSLETRWDGERVSLGRRDLAELMVIHAANLADQASRPTPWLAAASRFLVAARADLDVVPPVLGAALVTREEEAALGHAYRALLRGEAGWDRDVVSASPVGEPLVLAGLRALAGRSAREARALGERARAAFDAWGTPWDKRLALTRWRELADLVARDGGKRGDELDAAARRAGLVLEKVRGSPSRLWTGMDARGAFGEGGADAAPAPRHEHGKANGVAHDDGALPARFVQYIGGLRTNTEQPLLRFYPGIRVQPWHEPRELPIVADLERLAPRIAEEARGLPAELFQDEAENIGRSGRWSILFLLQLGRRHEANLARCPALSSLIDRHKELLTYAGSMYFSCLDPHTRVESHRGPTNMRLRCHLGLEVPEGCGVKVGGITSGWQQGRAIVFDDSFPHEVWNDSDQRRVVLVLDLWHPDLTQDEIALLVGLERYGAAHAPAPKRDGAAPAPEDRIATLRRDIAARPGDARLHLLLGHELSVAHRWAEAASSARAVLAIDPSHAMAHNNLGYALQMQRDTAGAIAAYEKALALDASCGRARRNLASLFRTLRRYPEALPLRQVELREAPDDVRALGDVVDAAMRAGELRIAAEHAEKNAGLRRGTRWYPVRRDDDPELPAWERVLTPGKLLHDIEQFEYLRGRGLLGDELGPAMLAYEDLLDTLRPLGPEARVPLAGALLAQVGDTYNRLIHVRDTPRVARTLSSSWSPSVVEEEFLARRPNVVVVDDFLTDEALRSLRAFCLESTVWSENRYRFGRLGSMFGDGFNCPLLIQLAEELSAAFPRVLSDLPVRQIWGYKYASVAPGETPHADFSCVNVNVWITPEEANLDPSTGGLDVYDAAAPEDWDHATYNNNEGVKIRAFLAERSPRPRHIPYRENRALIFDSAVFHATPAIKFKSGYENRRMNVTVLYGSRRDP